MRMSRFMAMRAGSCRQSSAAAQAGAASMRPTVSFSSRFSLILGRLRPAAGLLAEDLDALNLALFEHAARKGFGLSLIRQAGFDNPTAFFEALDLENLFFEQRTPPVLAAYPY